MVEEPKKNNSWIGLAAGAILIGGVLWFIFGRLESKSWTLFIYSSVNPDQDFFKNRVENIDSQEACIQSGISYTANSGSYECAYNCKYRKEYNSEICERTCDHGGCRE